MISLILMQKILSLFMIMALGFLLVRLKFLQSQDSRTVSTIAMYLINPCSILSAFQIEMNPDIVNGVLLAFGASLLLHVLLMAAAVILRRWLRFDPVETVSVIYSNAGNLVIPLVYAMFGAEWVIYSAGFISVQLFFLWSHGKALLCGDGRMDLKKVLLNVNLLSVIAGILIMVTGFRFITPVQTTIDSLAVMIGPMAMLVTGMLLGGKSFQQLLAYKRLPLIVLLRLIVIPLLSVLVLKMLPLSGLAENGTTILLIVLLATMTPSASTVTQMAVVYHKDADYSSAINVCTTLGCILSMPLMVWIYQL